MTHQHPPRNGQAARILLHPDYTVGPGVSPDLLTPRPKPKALAGYTAGGELHPALRMSEMTRTADF